MILRSTSRSGLGFGLAVVVCMTGSALAQRPLPAGGLDGGRPRLARVAPAAPSDLRILPDHSATKAAVVFFEDNSGNETKFEIERKTGAGAYALVHSPGVNDAAVEKTVEWTDTPLANATYTYRVRAVNADGNSAYSNECVVDFGTNYWPIPAPAGTEFEILHSFGDGLGLAAERMHHGVDVQGGDGGQDVRPAKAGLAFALVGAGDNRGVWLMYLQDGIIWHWHANHLDQIEANVAAVAYGNFATYRTITAGTKIGRLTKTVWTSPWNHVHVQFNRNGVEGAGTLTTRLKDLANYKYDEDRFKHPLSLYITNAFRDPQEKKPAPRDANNNMKTIEFNEPNGTDFGYDPNTMPLSGDVDIAVELYDEMGTDPAQTVDRLQWWIAPPKGNDPNASSVRTSAKPYTLVAFAQNFMKDANWDVIYDSNRAANPAGYPWANYHHYILTNTKHDNGLPASLDKNQYWRTKAKQDDSSVEANSANMFDKAQATKASEARFPDGDYTVHVKMSDIVNVDEPAKWEKVWVDNYPPALIELEHTDGGPDPMEDSCATSIRLTFSEHVLYSENVDIKLTDDDGSELGLTYSSDPADPRVVIITFNFEAFRLSRYHLTITKDVRDYYDKKLDSQFGNPNHNGTGGEADDGIEHAFCYCGDSADLDGDGQVNQTDQDIFLDAFGSQEGDDNYVVCLDYDESGQIDFIDLQVWWNLQN